MKDNIIWHGISLKITLRAGIHLSLQGSGSNYCTPRKLSDEYEELEIAIIDGNEGFIQIEDDDVLGWANFDKIRSVAEKYSGKKLHELLINKDPEWLKRENAPWDVGLNDQKWPSEK